MQAQKVRPAQRQSSQVVQKQALLGAIVTPQQMLQVIQTALQMVIGNLAYSRGLLPQENLTPRTFNADTFTAAKDPLSNSQLYPTQQRHSSNSATQSSPFPSSTPSRFQVFKIAPGASKEGDQIMSYVMEGVMPAIAQQFLKTLTLFVFLDPNNSDHIVESYKIEFEYDGAAIKASFGSSTSPASPSSTAALRSPMTVGELRGAINPFLYAVATTIGQAKLAELPRSKYLDIKLDFNDKAPPDYQLPSFAPYTRELWMRTASKYEVPSSVGCGRMDAASKETALSFGLAIQSVANYLGGEPPLGQELSDDHLSQLRDSQIKHAESLPFDWLVCDIPDAGPPAYPFPPEEVCKASLPGVRDIFGRFGERTGPWGVLEVKAPEETLPPGSQEVFESHKTLPGVYPTDDMPDFTIGDLLSQIQAAPSQPGPPSSQRKPSASRKVPKHKNPGPKKAAAPRKSGAASAQSKTKPSKPKPQPMRKRVIKSKRAPSPKPKHKPGPKPQPKPKPPAGPKATAPAKPLPVESAAPLPRAGMLPPKSAQYALPSGSAEPGTALGGIASRALSAGSVHHRPIMRRAQSSRLIAPLNISNVVVRQPRLAPKNRST